MYIDLATVDRRSVSGAGVDPRISGYGKGRGRTFYLGASDD